MFKMIFTVTLILLSFIAISATAFPLAAAQYVGVGGGGEITLEDQLELAKRKVEAAAQVQQKINVNIQKMPVQWQDKFGDVLYNATKYWENRLPGLKFYSVPYPHQADFVVTWASQYLEGKLGYYTPNTNNEYGKPYVAITLGYFKDKKWNLVAREYVIEITKHELGHAIGLKHSNDPKDIMYPYIHNYERWLLEQNANLLSDQKVNEKPSVTSHLSI
ncbi:MAG: matrixin family metalloprotease, partial [Nitrososphaeraceae archaeon]